MRIWRRAFLYLTRNRKKTTILTVILTLLSTLVLLCSSVGNAANESVQGLREQMGGYFKIETDFTQGKPGRVDDALVRKVVDAGGIKAFNGIDVRYFLTEDLELLPGRFTGERDVKAKLARFLGNTDSSRNEYFMLKYYSLSSGRHIGPEDHGKALISDALAERNRLSVGDVFDVRYYAENLTKEQKALASSHTVEVVGIYHIDSAQSYQSSNAAEYEMEENFIFTDTSLIREVYGEIGGIEIETYTSGAAFFVKDPKELDQILGNLLEWQDYDWNEYSLVKNNKRYEDSAAPLERLSGLVVMMTAVIAVVSGGMLSLIMFLWMRERTHEIGIYLSIGIRKMEIVRQHILENMLIGAFAFVLAFGISAAASGLTAQAIQDSFLTNSDAEASQGREDAEDFELEIGIGAAELAQVAGYGFLILLFSTGASSVPVARMQPKDIFSKMG